MRNLIIILSLCISGCGVSNNIQFDTKISERIFVAQDKNRIFSNSAYWSREEFIKKVKKIDVAKSDTIFMFERISEPDLGIWSNIWTSKRDVVHEYEGNSGMFSDTVLNYKTWQNYYRESVERFDTATVEKHKILGGYRSFMTQVIKGREVKTFFFMIHILLFILADKEISYLTTFGYSGIVV